MPIRRGEDWGEPGGLGPDGVLVDSDDEARSLIEEARRANRPLPEIGLLGGDLCRSLGGRGDPSFVRSSEAWRFAVDLGAVLLDGRLFWFCAHMVARRRGWAGEALVAMNAAWRGTWKPGIWGLELIPATDCWTSHTAGCLLGTGFERFAELALETTFPIPRSAIAV